MSGTGSETQHAPNRWWEGRPSGRGSQEGRYSELLTGGHGRNRTERSLSVGLDTPEEASSWWRANLWWIVSSAIAVVIMIVLLVLALVL